MAGPALPIAAEFCPLNPSSSSSCLVTASSEAAASLSQHISTTWPVFLRPTLHRHSECPTNVAARDSLCVLASQEQFSCNTPRPHRNSRGHACLLDLSITAGPTILRFLGCHEFDNERLHLVWISDVQRSHDVDMSAINSAGHCIYSALPPSFTHPISLPPQLHTILALSVVVSSPHAPWGLESIPSKEISLASCIVSDDVVTRSVVEPTMI